MNREKIEIVNAIVNDCGKAPCLKCMWCDQAAFSHAEALYNAGYRKQSENTVEVVRCKDCKHYKPQTQSKWWDNKTKYCCRGTTVKVKDNDFCSYGEPKMKGGE